MTIDDKLLKDPKKLKGSSILFEMEFWDDRGKCRKGKFKEKVIRIVQDPLKRHESKLVVKIQADDYAIPISEVIMIYLDNSKQLRLFDFG